MTATVLAPEFTYPVLFLGTKPTKTVHYNRRDIVFAVPEEGAEFDRPYAYVTEAEGRHLVRRFPELFAFAPGLAPVADSEQTRKALDEALDRIDQLETTLTALVERVDTLAAPKKPGRPKASDEET